MFKKQLVLPTRILREVNDFVVKCSLLFAEGLFFRDLQKVWKKAQELNKSPIEISIIQNDIKFP